MEQQEIGMRTRKNETTEERGDRLRQQAKQVQEARSKEDDEIDARVRRNIDLYGA